MKQALYLHQGRGNVCVHPTPSQTPLGRITLGMLLLSIRIFPYRNTKFGQFHKLIVGSASRTYIKLSLVMMLLKLNDS